MENSSNNLDINQFVTDLLTKELKAGRIPWKRPWTASGIPMNPVTKLPYLGINQLLLSSLGYFTNYFETLNQIKEQDGKVKPGEKGYSIVYWKNEESKDQKATIHTYTVFNVEQCSGLPEIEIPKLPDNSHNICKEIVENMPQKPHIQHDGRSPEFIINSDVIVLPPFKSFPGTDQYYYAIFCQLIIATGSEIRLNRKEITLKYSYDSKMYALRELTSEIGAFQLASIVGINIPQPEYKWDYIKSWVEKLERDKYLAINAANKAQQSVNLILNQSLGAIETESNEFVPLELIETHHALQDLQT